MCGIAGYISTNNTEVPAQLIQRMTDAVAHRGPDGAGIWQRGAVSLGHRRLSILDLSEQGRQPMLDGGSGRVISFNGEIYNYIELREELSKRGYAFQSNTDTEVILKAYDCWGESCVERFNGMWAFAIYDPRRNLVFCSRDRFGVKPFYYAELTEGFAFGSEIRQLLPLLPRVQANTSVLLGFLVGRVAENVDHSFFDGIRKLPGGHNLTFDVSAGTYSVRRYYNLEPKSDHAMLDLDGAVERFQELFDESIKLRLRSDVRVGTCLSGGMDSSSIATVAASIYRQQSGQDFSAITAISEDPATDESAFARSIVENSGLDWIRIMPGYEDFSAAIGEVVRAQEEPFASASVCMQFFVMREARRAGIPVLLDGQAGDETLLGYDRYFADHFLQSLQDGDFNSALGVVSGLRRNGRTGALRALLWNAMYFHAPLLKRLATRDQMALFQPRLAAQVLAAATPERSYSGIFGMQKQEIERTNLPVLLRYEDKNSMAHSIETRLPFLDYRLVEFSTSVATRIKLNDGWGKFLLRKSMEKRMPSDIVWRKHKFGFEAPESRWMSRHSEEMHAAIVSSPLLKELVSSDVLEEEGLKRANRGLLWRMFSAAEWAREFNVNELSEA